MLQMCALVKDVGLVPVQDNAAVGDILRQKVAQPHFWSSRFAEPTPIGMPVKTMDCEDAKRFAMVSVGHSQLQVGVASYSARILTPRGGS